jgi:hypothetical protein
MTTPLIITSLDQGKLHKNYEELCDEATRQHEAIANVARLFSFAPPFVGRAISTVKNAEPLVVRTYKPAVRSG